MGKWLTGQGLGEITKTLIKSYKVQKDVEGLDRQYRRKIIFSHGENSYFVVDHW